MSERAQKIVFFVVSILLLAAIVYFSMSMKDSKSQYVTFPNKIDTFR